MAKKIFRCGDCVHMTNIKPENRSEDNVMGGCFIDGRIVYSDDIACKKWKKWLKGK